MWGDGVAECGWEGVEGGERAVVRWGGGEGHGVAEVVASGEAEGACVAGVAGLEGDAVAGFEGCDGGATRVDYPCGFVAEDEGGGDFEGVDFAMLPVVYLEC